MLVDAAVLPTLRPMLLRAAASQARDEQRAASKPAERAAIIWSRTIFCAHSACWETNFQMVVLWDAAQARRAPATPDAKARENRCKLRSAAQGHQHHHGNTRIEWTKRGFEGRGKSQCQVWHTAKSIVVTASVHPQPPSPKHSGYQLSHTRLRACLRPTQVWPSTRGWSCGRTARPTSYTLDTSTEGTSTLHMLEHSAAGPLQQAAHVAPIGTVATITCGTSPMQHRCCFMTGLS